jgi:hypothetical protein
MVQNDESLKNAYLRTLQEDEGDFILLLCVEYNKNESPDHKSRKEKH